MSRKNFGAKPFSYPQPVLIIAAYGENDVPSAMNAAWGGVGDDHQVFLCLSKEHMTVKNILKRKAFTVQVATENLAVQSDFVGIISANNNADKFAKSGLKEVKSDFVDAPVLVDYPISIECSFVSYDEKHCHLFADIVNASVDDSVLTNGKIDVAKLKPLAFDIDNAQYLSFDKVFAKAFEIGKKLK